MIERLRCLFGAHMPKRSRAKFDGSKFRAPCRHCGIGMVREDTGWRAAPKAARAAWPELPVAPQQEVPKKARIAPSEARPAGRKRLRVLAGFSLALLLAVLLGYVAAPTDVQLRGPDRDHDWRRSFRHAPDP